MQKEVEEWRKLGEVDLGKENEEFSFGCAKFDTSLRHLSRSIMYVVTWIYMSRVQKRYPKGDSNFGVSVCKFNIMILDEVAQRESEERGD